jgi:hypothetical protein
MENAKVKFSQLTNSKLSQFVRVSEEKLRFELDWLIEIFSCFRMCQCLPGFNKFEPGPNQTRCKDHADTRLYDPEPFTLLLWTHLTF